MDAVEGKSIVSLQTCTLPDYKQRLIVQGEWSRKRPEAAVGSASIYDASTSAYTLFIADAKGMIR